MQNQLAACATQYKASQQISVCFLEEAGALHHLLCSALVVQGLQIVHSERVATLVPLRPCLGLCYDTTVCAWWVVGGPLSIWCAGLHVGCQVALAAVPHAFPAGPLGVLIQGSYYYFVPVRQSTLIPDWASKCVLLRKRRMLTCNVAPVHVVLFFCSAAGPTQSKHPAQCVCAQERWCSGDSAWGSHTSVLLLLLHAPAVHHTSVLYPCRCVCMWESACIGRLICLGCSAYMRVCCCCVCVCL